MIKKKLSLIKIIQKYNCDSPLSGFTWEAKWKSYKVDYCSLYPERLKIRKNQSQQTKA